MKITALTYKTLTRFEKIIRPENLTESQAERIEHLAYCANMGADSEETAWNRFADLVYRELNIDLKKEEADRENREHCKRIAEELEAYAEGTVYRCAECGEICTIEEAEGEEGFTVYKTSCGCTLDYEPEQLSAYDFIADAYDIEYRIGSDMEYRSAKIMVACGGPNIYIDTARRLVTLHWWTDYAEYPISSDAAEELDNVMEELYQCH